MQRGFVLSVYKDSPGQGVKIINIIITFHNFLKLQDRARKELVFMVDKTELPVPFMAGAGKDIDLMSFQVFLQQPQRNHCQTAIDLYCIKDAVGGGLLKGCADMKKIGRASCRERV